MSLNFCTRTIKRLRRIGLPKKTARRFAGFFYVSMVSVCGLMGATPDPRGRGGTMEETLRFLHWLLLLPSVLLYSDASYGISAPGPRAVWIAPGYSRIHRR
jgi:hypothetical protein